jgi:diguanylate cyclase (GGDEF)-like protein
MHHNEKARILIVDDEKMNLKVLAELLKDEYAPVFAESGNKALQHAFGDFPPDLILLDVMMPGMGGYEVIRHLKNNDKTNNIPVIFVTALNSIEDEEQGFKLGAVDYITKPFSPPIVKMRIRNHLRIVHQYKLLDQLAYLDGLTEISNRRRFDEVFPREWARSARNRTPFSLLMIDVDYFKQYNDHYGHAMGDLTLQKIATTLTGVLRRPADLIARYGGEEFVMLLPDTDAVGGKFIADRSLELIIELDIPHDFSQVAKMVSVSIGLATINMDMDNKILPQFFLETADHSLYQAKQGGRNRVVCSVLGQSFSAN